MKIVSRGPDEVVLAFSFEELSLLHRCISTLSDDFDSVDGVPYEVTEEDADSLEAALSGVMAELFSGQGRSG